MSLILLGAAALWFLPPCWRVVFLVVWALVALRFVWKWRNARTLPVVGKSVAITGCDTGFGYMTALALDQLGARVFALCLTEKGASELRQKASANVDVFVGNVVSEEDMARWGAHVTAKTAGQGLWGLVNNAGIARGSAVELTLMRRYREVLDVNFFGVVLATKTFLPLIKLARGRVVNVASLAGRMAAPGMSAYCASKYAVEAFSDSLRREMRLWKVNVSIIEPGFMRTPIVTGVKDMLVQSFEESPKHIQEAYGMEFITETQKNAQRALDNSDPPEKVVDKIVQALRATSPELRYPVGRGAQSMWLTLAALPGNVQDVLIGFAVTGSIPAGARRT